MVRILHARVLHPVKEAVDALTLAIEKLAHPLPASFSQKGGLGGAVI
jgi:hypothetical protein